MYTDYRVTRVNSLFILVVVDDDDTVAVVIVVYRPNDVVSVVIMLSFYFCLDYGDKLMNWRSS